MKGRLAMSSENYSEILNLEGRGFWLLTRSQDVVIVAWQPGCYAVRDRETGEGWIFASGPINGNNAHPMGGYAALEAYRRQQKMLPTVVESYWEAFSPLYCED